MMKRLVVTAVAAFLAFGAHTANAAEITTIKYSLGGVLEVLSPVVFSSPVYESGISSAPQNIQKPTGSSVQFNQRLNSRGASMTSW